MRHPLNPDRAQLRTNNFSLQSENHCACCLKELIKETEDNFRR